jgi:hypothetical protein
MTLTTGLVRLEPLTVNVTSTLVAADKGVISTELVVAVAGVAPDITQLYVGLVMLLVIAARVALGGVNAPLDACTKEV